MLSKSDERSIIDRAEWLRHLRSVIAESVDGIYGLQEFVAAFDDDRYAKLIQCKGMEQHQAAFIFLCGGLGKLNYRED